MIRTTNQWHGSCRELVESPMNMIVLILLTMICLACGMIMDYSSNNFCSMWPGPLLVVKTLSLWDEFLSVSVPCFKNWWYTMTFLDAIFYAYFAGEHDWCKGNVPLWMQVAHIVITLTFQAKCISHVIGNKPQNIGNNPQPIGSENEAE